MKKSKHHYLLNPFPERAFTRCPKCNMVTKLWKFCLVINVAPQMLLSLKKTCRYCPNCDLVIIKQQELEKLLYAICEQYIPDNIGNDYFLIGTMDREEWRKAQLTKCSSKRAIEELTYPFKSRWDIKVIAGGWTRNSNV